MFIPAHWKGYTDVPKRLFHETGKALPQSERAFSASLSGVNETGEKDN